MKIKHLFLTAIAAITLAACGSQTSKEEVKESKQLKRLKLQLSEVQPMNYGIMLLKRRRKKTLISKL